MASDRALIVLAAGRGSRFRGDSHKLASSIGEETVLAATLRHAVESRLHVVVVATEPLAAIARQMIAARDIVVLPEVGHAAGETLGDLELGMGRSIAAGVTARPEASGWLVLPGDMPIVQPDTMVAVAAALDHHPVAFAQHNGRRGHPVGFAAELFSELIALRGDEGARRIVARYPAAAVECDDPGIFIDIDTTSDLEEVLSGDSERGVPPDLVSRF